jgi:hypothetical protein
MDWRFAMRVFPMMMLCAALALGGCDAFESHPSGPLVADVRSPITDVPVPAGFTMAPESNSTVSGGQRTVNHKYTGSDQVLPVASFYKDEMPKRGWKLEGTEQPSGKEVVLHFSKEKAAKPEGCTVTVTARDFDTAIRVKIESK